MDIQVVYQLCLTVLLVGLALSYAWSRWVAESQLQDVRRELHFMERDCIERQMERDEALSKCKALEDERNALLKERDALQNDYSTLIIESTKAQDALETERDELEASLVATERRIADALKVLWGEGEAVEWSVSWIPKEKAKT